MTRKLVIKEGGVVRQLSSKDKKMIRVGDKTIFGIDQLTEDELVAIEVYEVDQAPHDPLTEELGEWAIVDGKGSRLVCICIMDIEACKLELLIKLNKKFSDEIDSIALKEMRKKLLDVNYVADTVTLNYVTMLKDALEFDKISLSSATTVQELNTFKDSVL